ncbi:MAG: methyltransferase domain-containing protein [Phenylobacterium sp.]|uniref:class I SAM-dependent methyltransferase n=1 Tax=Phenylobacterium sp. TaxID=1871053 RepID=UPI0025E3A048|nr:class I SAM-dependent methyltransferase [Phenylobacterium sp.]MBI1200432.1 methyltransferase domain-containing protein [Phenylobacterium sp.]
MASFYDRHILPRLLKCACSAPGITEQRAKVVPNAEGRVLELGIGMGLNLAFYDASKVESVTGVDPTPELRAIAEAAPRDPGLSVKVEDGTAEALPFDDKSFDCVVCTFTLCSVHTPAQALAEARRVLKPGGRFLYCEHGLSPDAGVAKWQRRIEPIWKRLAGGCHLTRPVTSSIEAAGFKVAGAERMYMPKAPRIAGWMEWGAATT